MGVKLRERPRGQRLPLTGAHIAYRVPLTASNQVPLLEQWLCRLDKRVNLDTPMLLIVGLIRVLVVSMEESISVCYQIYLHIVYSCNSVNTMEHWLHFGYYTLTGSPHLIRALNQ